MQEQQQGAETPQMGGVSTLYPRVPTYSQEWLADHSSTVRLTEPHKPRCMQSGNVAPLWMGTFFFAPYQFF